METDPEEISDFKPVRVLKFIVHLHLLVLPSTTDAVRRAGQDPLNVGAELMVAGEQGRIVFDAVVGCGSCGLPADLLLSFSPDILCHDH